MSRSTTVVLAFLGASLLGCHDDGGANLVALAGPQLGAITIDLATGAVTVGAQPQALTLTGAAVYDDPADTLTISLTVKNRSKTVLSNPKVLVTAVSDGAVTGDGTYADGGHPYVAFGPESLGKGKSVTRDVVVDGVVGGAGTVALDLDVRHSGWIFANGGWDTLAAADSAGTGDTFGLDVSVYGPYGNETQFDPGAASGDGRYAYFSVRNQPAVARLDLTTFAVTFTKSLMGGLIDHDGNSAPGHIDSLTLSPDGKLVYAVLMEGAHRYRYAENYPPPNVTLVRLGASDLDVKKKLELYHTTFLDDGGGGYLEYRGRKLSLSADGTRGAVAVTELGVVYLVGLDGMRVIDVDDVTPGEQGFDVSGVSPDPRFAAISPAGDEIYVAFCSSAAPDDGALLVIDVATGTTGTLAPPTLSGGDNHPGALEFGPDGRLYYARIGGSVPGLSIYDPAGDAWIELAAPTSCSAVAFVGGEYLAFDDATQTAHRFDAATDVELASEGGGALGVFIPGAGSGHGLVLSGE